MTASGWFHAMGLAQRSRDEETARAAVVATARALEACRLVIGSAGNVSVRVADDLQITPTRVPYECLTAEMIVRTSIGEGGDASGVASTELPLHRAVYQARGDVAAVVHTHSAHATAWSFLGRPLVPDTEDLSYHEIGRVQTSRPAVAGSVELGCEAVRALGSRRAVLLAGHGVLTVGANVDAALTAAAVVEHQAQVAWLLRNEGILEQKGSV